MIYAGLDDREWALFEDAWSHYKVMLNVNDHETRKTIELCAACSEEVNKLLFEYIVPEALKTCSEIKLLKHVKGFAVNSIYKELQKMAFNKMCQNT